ncbi:Blue copper protein [Quillaja saponaria]|uniref:Blue copper protein n=1 Tax=Quillaja saponaria TaxID=32244 RepID=A0AAD7LEJ7_QUISA|nr:Blue copper protein [Quillaja saponaria]
MSSRLDLMCCLIAAMALVMTATHVSAAEYNVGDSLGWTVPPNQNYYSDWASTKRFFLGDKLIFNWTGTHTVGDLSKADYDNCTTEIGKVSGPVFTSNLNQTVFTVTLNQTGPRYFLCTVSTHCSSGQKFSINVESLNSDTPAPAEGPDSSAPALSFGVLSALFVSSMVFYSYF